MKPTLLLPKDPSARPINKLFVGQFTMKFYFDVGLWHCKMSSYQINLQLKPCAHLGLSVCMPLHT